MSAHDNFPSSIHDVIPGPHRAADCGVRCILDTVLLSPAPPGAEACTVPAADGAHAGSTGGGGGALGIVVLGVCSMRCCVLQCEPGWVVGTDIEPPPRLLACQSSYTWAAIFPSQVGWGSDEDEEQALAAASPISTAPSLPAAAPPGAAQQTAQLAAQQAAGRGACDGLHPSSSTLPAEEAQRELLQEGEQAEAAEAAAAAEQPLPAAQEAVNAREFPVAAGTACPAVTISSDTSVASGEHWQVVTSSKPAAGGEEEEEEQPPQQQLAAAQQQQQQQQQQEKQAATADAKAEAAEGKLAAAAAAGKLAATGAAAAGAAAGAGAAADDEQLSDWGDEDDAALEAAAAGTTGEGAAGGDSDWGSDWE